MKDVRLNTKLIKSIKDVVYRQASEIRKATGIPRTSWYTLMARPEGITVQQLLAIANGLSIPVSRFFSTGPSDAVGSRDDYVTDPYLECYYDADALQEIVENRPDATWKMASDATGVTRDHLRRSLLAIRRTPVDRFLASCRALGIDPFDVLIDPNPRKEGRRKGAGRGAAGEMAALRQDIARLEAAVGDLKSKYEALLKAHEQLAKSAQVNIGSISGSNISTIGIAADQIVKQETDK